MATKLARRASRGGVSRPRKRASRGRELDGTASALIVLIANRLASGASNAYRECCGIGTVESRILAHLAVERWVAPQRICRAGGLDKGAVSRSARLLEEAGLISVRNSPDDARSVELAPTAKGLALHARIERIARERERRLLAGLSQAEVRSLIATLRRLGARISAVNAPLPRR